jgi:hypothetical protein
MRILGAMWLKSCFAYSPRLVYLLAKKKSLEQICGGASPANAGTSGGSVGRPIAEKDTR